MENFVKRFSLDERISCFAHEGFKIEAFKSIVKDPYVNVSYEKDSTTYPCNTIEEAQSFADLLINEYLNKIKSVEEFFDGI